MKIIKDPDFAKRCDEARNTVEYKLERAMIDFTERICARLDELNITQRELADRMGVTRSQITNLLRGEYKNFTFETAIRIACALEMDFEPFLASRTGLSCKCGQIRVGIVEGVLKAKPNSTWHPAVMQPEYVTHDEGSLIYDNAAVANVEYFFTKINLEPKFGKVPQKGVYPLQTRIGFQDGKCPGELVINLGVRKGADAVDEKGTYAFEIGVSGIFSADKALYDKDAEKAVSIVKVNGTSMLLGAVRELVLQLSSRGPFPAYTIPALSFVDLIKPKRS